MHIAIAQRIQPFSHLPGTTCVVPGSSCSLQIFPTRLCLYSLGKTAPQLIGEWHLEINGPLLGFTVISDLERGEIRVQGQSATGWLRYCICTGQSNDAICLLLQKAPQGRLRIEGQQVTVGDWFPLTSSSSLFIPYRPSVVERLALGSHKAQDIEWIQRRCDMVEIWPIWYRLGQLTPFLGQWDSVEGTLMLLKLCEEGQKIKKPEQLISMWINSFKAGFTSLLTPQLTDPFYQGLTPQEHVQGDLSPLVFLTEGTRLIRQHFIRETLSGIEILPVLPPECHAGRLIHVSIAGGHLDLEWSKKMIRRLILRPLHTQLFQLKFLSVLTSFRLRSIENKKGTIHKCGEALELNAHHHYFFDNFK